MGSMSVTQPRYERIFLDFAGKLSCFDRLKTPRTDKNSIFDRLYGCLLCVYGCGQTWLAKGSTAIYT